MARKRHVPEGRLSPTISAMRLRTGLAILPLVLVPLAACAPEDDDSGTTASDDQTSSSPTEETSGSTTPTEEATEAGLSPECAPDQLPLNAAGQLTIATDSPAYEPWFVDDDPTNGKGYESAVAYAVAEKLGFGHDQVEWTVVPFNTSYKPGDKDFDFDINQISISPERAKVVDFSDGYYSAAQALVALEGDDITSATSLADLASYKLGAQTGTTSLTAIRDTIQPGDEPAVFEDTNAAKQALLNDQVDGDRRRPADGVLHHRGGDQAQRDRRAVPAGERRAGAVRAAVPEGQPAGPVRQRGTGRAHGGRDARRAPAAVALQRGGRPGPPVRTR